MRNYGSESCPLRGSAPLRLETLLESAAGEMLSSAGKNHRQEGGEGWGGGELIALGRTLNSLVILLPER